MMQLFLFILEIATIMFMLTSAYLPMGQDREFFFLQSRTLELQLHPFVVADSTNCMGQSEVHD